MENNLQFQIETEIYKGPFDKLLSLVEEKKLEITQISLAKITNDFLNYLSSLEKKAKDRKFLNELIADFILVAAKLVFIKSKMLLPEKEIQEEEEEERSLAEQLKLYQEFKNVSQKIKTIVEKERYLFFRPPLAEKKHLGFFPGKITIFDLEKTMKKFFASFEKINQNIKKRIREKKINLVKKIESLYHFLKKIKKTSFDDLFQRKDSPREEIISSFLALLYLFSQEKICLEQKEPFGRIEIKVMEDDKRQR